MVLWIATRPSRTNTKKRCPFHHKGLECKSRKSRDTCNNRQIWPWSTKCSRAKTNRGNIPQHNKDHIWQTYSQHHTQQWKVIISPNIKNKIRIMCLPGWGRGLGENGYMFWYGCVPSLFSWNCHNIVIQLYSNTNALVLKHTTKIKKNIFKKKTRMSTLATFIQHSFGIPSHGNQKRKNERNPN